MPTVNIEKKNIITVEYHQEKADYDYGSCLWADFNFNLDDYSLMIMSDCGAYSYGWSPTPATESFIKLMKRINGDYLLSKISDMTEFNIEQSKKETIKNVAYNYDEDDKEFKDICDEINDIEDRGEDLFYDDVDTILANNDFCDTYGTIEICKEFPKEAERIVKIFVDYIQPKLWEVNNNA